MLRTTNPERSLWEAILPAEVIGLSTELTMVDRLLDDPVFIQPFPGPLRPDHRPSLDPDRYLPAADVLEVPLRAGL
jgi:IS5 family transposase